MKTRTTLYGIFSITAAIIIAGLWISMKSTNSLLIEYLFGISIAITGAIQIYFLKSNFQFLEYDELEKTLKLNHIQKLIQ